MNIVLGISGLLALFLTIVFVVKGAVIFPAAAALGWAVLPGFVNTNHVEIGHRHHPRSGGDWALFPGGSSWLPLVLQRPDRPRSCDRCDGRG